MRGRKCGTIKIAGLENTPPKNYDVERARFDKVIAANAICDKVDRTASKEVALGLLQSQCRPIPTLMCVLECLLCFPLPKNDLKSLDFTDHCHAIFNETI